MCISYQCVDTVILYLSGISPWMRYYKVLLRPFYQPGNLSSMLVQAIPEYQPSSNNFLVFIVCGGGYGF